jgi:hypothetical protein
MSSIWRKAQGVVDQIEQVGLSEHTLVQGRYDQVAPSRDGANRFSGLLTPLFLVMAFCTAPLNYLYKNGNGFPSGTIRNGRPMLLTYSFV